MIREAYKKNIKTLFSMKNEPKQGEYRAYPDMFETYRIFSDKFEIPLNEFILTNGCENAARWASLFFKDDTIHIEDPSWGMMQVICEAFGIKYDLYKYNFDAKTNKFYAKPQKGVVYTTDEYNNLFKHETVKFDRGILDETYTLKNLFDPNRILNKNKIIIGSFSKFAGCGIRLGYVLFNKMHNDYFQMLREQYINAVAVQYIGNNLGDLKKPNLCLPLTSDSMVSRHDVYTTYKDKAPSVPRKRFEISNTAFYRVGV